MHFIAFQIQTIKLELKNLVFNNFKVPFNVKTLRAGFAKMLPFSVDNTYVMGNTRDEGNLS